jgi:hypothetical protein
MTTPVKAQESPADEPAVELEPVAYFNGPMPTGVTVSQRGRVFVNFPKWGDDVEFTVGELKDGEATTTCASTSVAEQKAWPSSPTRRRRGRTESSS